MNRVTTLRKLTAPVLVAGLALPLAACGGEAGGGAEDGVVVFGLSAPLSGDAAGWGSASKWLAEKAADEINAAGGIETEDGSVEIEIVIQDNEYTAAGGARAAQTLLTREKVDMIAFSVGTAPVQALQSMTERQKVPMMTSAWGKDLKGPDFPYTFTVINTPFEVLRPLAEYVLEAEGGFESIALLGVNDATGIQSEEVAQEVWAELGVEVVSSDFYEHGTTEFAPIATKLLRTKPDAIDLTTVTPGPAGLLLQALEDQGWDGPTLLSAGTGGQALVEAASGAAEGVYMGLAADFSDTNATEKQQELQAGLEKATGEDLNGVTIGAYDGVIALAAAIEEAGTIESDAVREALTEITFESSWGAAAFGAEDVYGAKQQILTPMIVTQVRGDAIVEVERIVPAELESLQ
ncbi:ABC transporter substrate-binding protein [Nocardioides carbamazepini]|uniref:ABC transporter substrate-binding protein n=1 Tax=Nocardioides carbamazepini TaxID=2854259 RepID=UPI002149AB11|nr:ABC transporter substrate-binding protein [Nocardioides carbamazepini]MCR1783793.1 ABC transporter substrate-binding protein [Nocardioides carbamazepini]